MSGSRQDVAPLLDVTIDRLGAQGDGVAIGSDGPIYVPFTLPGEQIRAAIDGDRGRLVAITQASLDRVAPACVHFGRCGGCALQHMAPEAYNAFKAGLVAGALRARGFDISLETLIVVGHGARRRAVLAARRVGGKTLLGFHEAASHTLLPIEECPVLSARIVAALPALADLVAPLQSRSGVARVAVLAADNGLDVTVDDVEKVLAPDLRARLAKDAVAAGLVRLSINRDPVFSEAKPVVMFGSVAVNPPPGAFLQASAAAEAAIASLALEALPKRAKRVADLFAGLGAFTFPLAHRAAVLALDSDRSSLAALAAAARHAQGLKPIETRLRDLFREPLSRKELEGFDAVVFDPPRAGGEAQATALARSGVGTIVAVSCNPATLARDLRILADGGYVLERVTPIDQFLYSAHVEAVAVLRRP